MTDYFSLFFERKKVSSLNDMDVQNLLSSPHNHQSNSKVESAVKIASSEF